MENVQVSCRVSPAPRAHPLVRSLFKRMSEMGIGYARLETESGVKESTFKAWRGRNACGTNSIQAALAVVGLRALPVPRPEVLPADLLAELHAIGERHGVPLPISELVMVAADRPLPELIQGGK